MSPNPLPIRLLACAVASCCLTHQAVAASATFTSSSYLSVADSPFAGRATLVLETFEDGLLNVAGVTLVESGATILAPGAQTDSVDADDGAIDGFGINGRSLYSGGTLQTFTFDFSGTLPTYAGIVWTDIGSVTSGLTGVGDITFEAFGPGNLSLGSLGATAVGDGVATGGTGEDLFFGIDGTDGIARIRITVSNSTDWEVDHLQFGVTPIPAPAALWLLGPALAGLVARRRHA